MLVMIQVMASQGRPFVPLHNSRSQEAPLDCGQDQDPWGARPALATGPFYLQGVGIATVWSLAKCDLTSKAPPNTTKNAATNGQTSHHIAGLLAIC